MATGSLGQQKFIPTTTSLILILLGYRKSTVSSFTVDAKRNKRKQSMNIKLYLEDEKFNMLDQQQNEWGEKHSAKEDVSNSKLPNLNDKQKRITNYSSTAIVSRLFL